MNGDEQTAGRSRHCKPKALQNVGKSSDAGPHAGHPIDCRYEARPFCCGAKANLVAKPALSGIKYTRKEVIEPDFPRGANPAAYSFTSIAIVGSIKAFQGPVLEVHISSIHTRDKSHRHSKISSAATAVICGLG